MVGLYFYCFGHIQLMDLRFLRWSMEQVENSTLHLHHRFSSIMPRDFLHCSLFFITRDLIYPHTKEQILWTDAIMAKMSVLEIEPFPSIFSQEQKDFRFFNHHPCEVCLFKDPESKCFSCPHLKIIIHILYVGETYCRIDS